MRFGEDINMNNNTNEQPTPENEPEVDNESKEEFENKVIKIKKELFENAGNKNKEELNLLINDVEKIFNKEKESGKGKLKDKISEMSNGEHGKEKFVDGSIAYLPKDGEAIFIGDTHGDPDATVSIIEQEKFIEEMEKGKKNKYLVFLGDYADRGKGDIENLEQIVALKRKYPDNVILLRGNHEEFDTGNRYGLGSSIAKRYGGGEEDGGKLFGKYNKLFEKMPGVLVCANGVVAVHGGIPSEDIKSLKDLNDENKLYQMRWNDPVDYEKFKERGTNLDRGGNGENKISQFGRDAFDRFMNTVGGKVIIRGHEYENIGQPIFDNKLVTLFSNGSGGEKSHYKNINASYAKFDLEKEIDEIDDENIKELKYVKPNYELKQLADDPTTVKEDLYFKDEQENLNSSETVAEKKPINIEQKSDISQIKENKNIENTDSEDEINKEPDENESEDFNDLESEIDNILIEDEESEGKTGERLKEWKNKPVAEKEEDIKAKRMALENDLKENPEIPKGTMENIEEFRKYQNELKNKNEEFAQEREKIMEKIQGQLNEGVDLSNLDLGGQNEFRGVLSSFKNVTKNALDIEKIDYYLEAGENELGDLLDTHKNREISMETLEKILKQIGEFEEYLKKLESIMEEQPEIAKEEIKGLADKLKDIYNKNPELFKKLLAAGVVAGILILAAVVFGPGVAALFEWLPTTVDIGAITSGTAGAIKAGGALIGAVGGVSGGAAGFTAGALIGGGVLLKMMAWLSNGKNRDNLAEGVFGAKIPWWGYLAYSKSGDKK